MKKRTDLKISFECNNHCLFCVQGRKREMFKAKDMGRIREELERGYSSGSRALVITGGEPAINKNIFEIVRLARKTGYENVLIQTNGRMFRYPDFCKEMRDAGATEVSPALHGSSPQIHDFLTGTPGSFAETATGIINAKKCGFLVITNSVITKSNQQDLPRLAKLLCSLGADQFQMAFPHIMGSAMENSKWLIPKMSVIMPFVHKAMDIGRKNSIPSYTEAIPYCFMKGYENCVSERILPDTYMFDADEEIPDFKHYRINRGKSKCEKCHKCSYFNVCEGPWKEYPELFGWEEFIPVRR